MSRSRDIELVASLSLVLCAMKTHPTLNLPLPMILQASLSQEHFITIPTVELPAQSA